MLLNKKFIFYTENLVDFLTSVKKRLDTFDKNNKNTDDRINFVRENKKDIFKELDKYFEAIWTLVEDLKLSKSSYLIYQKYFYQRLYSFLSTEINRHIYQKPLGYSGDYITMNYIYDYFGDKNYLGDTSFEMLINNYTCNIPISRANIKRKEFIKKEIIKSLRLKNNPKICSVGSGPGREIIELLNENKINRSLIFKCIDYERKALDYIKKEIEKISERKKRYILIEYICKDITEIIRSKSLEEKIRDSDLIYAIGLFDYLTDKLAKMLCEKLGRFLNKNGKLIITNANLENNSHRGYYELLGDWKMIYRTRKEMLFWLEGFNDYSVEFKNVEGAQNYLFLTIKKVK